MNKKQVAYQPKVRELHSLIEELQSVNSNLTIKDSKSIKYLLEDTDDYLISKFLAFSELAEDNIPKIVKDSAKLEDLYNLFSELILLENKFTKEFKESKKMFYFIFYYSIFKYYKEPAEVNSLVEKVSLNRKINFEQFIEIYNLKQHGSFIDWYLDFYIINRKEKIFLNF